MTRRKGKSSTQQTNKSSEAAISGNGSHWPRSKARRLLGKFKDKLGLSVSSRACVMSNTIDIATSRILVALALLLPISR
ncbi:hypothetical protein CY34DRAFT_715723 [Suillus luteus UH-Slu-Lm8-n1]|uniref:Uncharacterized protein n=1 Tax=Suillus luteus UH-Slu-Lm8-n1 TaxID=930992 RepID=A0A0D0AGJ8_9AGAM|nr:hypothetical protein CY34DRAFT_715723 [Suillus luteus UH-Slu-Lm8-n1]